MNTIEAYEGDIELELNLLKSFKKQRPLSCNRQRNVIFSGSGDSLASAMLAESFSGGMVRAMDPLDIYNNRQLARSKHIYFVSISGDTITNINAAMIAKSATAITSKPQSRLAKVSDETILLTAPNNAVFTAGSISFLESALTCMSLVRKITVPRDPGLFFKARADAKKATVSKRIFVLGNLFTFPLAMYCASKFYEVLGWPACYSRIEQFSHMELFSARRGDTVIIFEEKNHHNRRLRCGLKKIGINVIHPNMPSEKISQMVYCTFFSQLLALFEAKKKRRKDCHFVTAKKIQNISNQMIY